MTSMCLAWNFGARCRNVDTKAETENKVSFVEKPIGHLNKTEV